VNQTLQNKSKTPLKKQVTEVKVDWREGSVGTPRTAAGTAWNEICIWCMENYGLPGDNYTWHAHTDYMRFDFYNEKDAVHFMLRWL
jgi:hypothetical protein